MVTTENPYEGVDRALDVGSWQRMQDTNPILADEIAAALARGVTPNQLRRHVARRGKPELARFVEEAARGAQYASYASS